MSQTLVVILFAIGALGFFVIGLSITLMVKGHWIDSEISTNKNMQRLGIKCAVQETREMDGTTSCDPGDIQHTAGCTGNCGACDIDHSKK